MRTWGISDPRLQAGAVGAPRPQAAAEGPGGLGRGRGARVLSQRLRAAGRRWELKPGGGARDPCGDPQLPGGSGEPRAGWVRRRRQRETSGLGAPGTLLRLQTRVPCPLPPLRPPVHLSTPPGPLQIEEVAALGEEAVVPGGFRRVTALEDWENWAGTTCSRHPSCPEWRFRPGVSRGVTTTPLQL